MFTRSTLLKKIKTGLRLGFADPKMLISRLQSFRKPPLFLFQMGKVASRTHDKTLMHLYYVQHFHDEIEFDAALHKGTKNFQGAEHYPYDIITATRDPISRKISAFFQNLTADYYDFSYATLEEAKAATVEDMVKRFHSWSDGINEATGWFDKHFITKTDIDVYEHDFDPAQGWSLIESEQYRVLIVKFEDIKKNHVDALNALVSKSFGTGHELAELQSNNLSDDKWYAEIMEEFKNKVRFTEDEINSAYDSKYMQHFYSKEQILALKAKWNLTKS